MKVYLQHFKEPTEAMLVRNELSARQSERDKIIFIASFDIQKLRQQKSVEEIARFFKTDEKNILKIERMQKNDLHLEQEFLDYFRLPEEEIQPNGAFRRLKQSSIYKRLIN